MLHEPAVQPFEMLRDLAHDYHHLKSEHERQGASSSNRRRLARRMDEVADRFSRGLAAWVTEAGDDLRARWLSHLHGDGPAPGEPRIAPPLVFRGRSDTGAMLEIRPAPDGAYDLLLDGTHLFHESIPWDLDPDAHEPVQVHGALYQEVFQAPEVAVRALDRLGKDAGAGPPWQWARTLVEEGLCDANFALTPRGERCLRAAREREGEQPGQPGQARFCVLVADAARARVLTLDAETGERGGQSSGDPARSGGGGDSHELSPTLAPLHEVADITNPASRARDSDILSDPRPGMRRESPAGPRHCVSDRRDSRRRDRERRFAEMAADLAATIWQGHPAATVIVAASPHMLGLLRPAIARRTRGPTSPRVRELARDLTRLTAPALHDALAQQALLPPRDRLPPPGPPRAPAPA